MVTGCLRLNDVSVICRVVNPRWTSQKIWGGFLYGVYRPGEWLWIDSNGKMETRNPVQGYFGREFPAIRNHCGVIVAWNHKTLKNFMYFCVFWGKTTHCGKIFKILFRKFSLRHRWTCCVHIPWNLADGKLVKSCNCLPDKKTKFRLVFQLSLLRISHPKSARDSLRQCTQSALQISSKSVHFRRSYSRTREHRQNAP